MSHALIITRDARQDIAEASNWYDEQESGIGRRFELALDLAFQQIQRDPHHFRPRGRKEIRLCRPRNWPYGIYFRIRETTCETVALVHAARDPKYLNYRLR